MKNLFKVALLFLMLTVFNLQAQDYSPLIYGNTSLFQFEGQSEFESRIEALQEEPGFISDYRGDAIKLLQAWNDDPTMECKPHNVATWAGPKYVKGLPPNSTPNTYYFFNKANEPIIFQPLKEVGETWTMYTYANGNYIEATISHKENLSFLELSDSVKTISLQLKNSSGTELSNPLNNIIYRVSKHYGLIQLTSFLDFPSAIAAANLVGLTVPKKGMQLITSREIFNFDIGDEFHYDSLFQSHYHVLHQSKTINIVTGIYRSANTDTVIYTFDQLKETRQWNAETSELTHYYSRENVQEKYTLSTSQLYPAQANLNTEPSIRNVSYWLTLFSDNVRLKWNTDGGMLYKQSDNDPTCWELDSYGSISFYSYLEGCGLSSDSMHYWNSAFDYGYKRLVYFKKGEQQWGDPLILSTTTKKESASLTLFPNPLKQGEILHVESDHFRAIHCTIFNSQGIQVYKSQNDTSVEYIDLKELEPGLYIVQLVNDKNEMLTSKLLIK